MSNIDIADRSAHDLPVFGLVVEHDVNEIDEKIDNLDHMILNFKCEVMTCLVVAMILSIGSFAISLYTLTS